MKRIAGRIKKKHFIEVSIYALVGCSALFTQTITYLLLCKLKTMPLLANFIGNLFGMVVSYFGHTRYTFKKTHMFSHKEFIKFIITSLIGLAITSVGIFLLVNMLKLSSNYGVIPMLLTPGVTFLISKFWAFR